MITLVGAGASAIDAIVGAGAIIGAKLPMLQKEIESILSKIEAH